MNTKWDMIYFVGFTGKIGGNLIITRTQLTSLPSYIDVSGYVALTHNSALTELPTNFKVGKWVDVKGCTGLQTLPPSMYVDGTVFGARRGIDKPSGVKGRLMKRWG